MSKLPTDQKSKPALVIWAWIITFLTAGYMLPWAIAATRGKANSGVIGLLNFFAGWTVIGWIAALVMACMPHRVAQVTSPVHTELAQSPQDSSNEIQRNDVPTQQQIASAYAPSPAAPQAKPGDSVYAPEPAPPTSAPAFTPAGWYPDPELPHGQRYWDGATWTEHRAPH